MPLPSAWSAATRSSAQAELLAQTTVRLPGTPAVQLSKLTDFQAALTSRGLMFLDFEPGREYAARLAGVQIP